MSTRHFCDRCDQQLIEPDENVNFITGQPTSANEDICWRCRLQEIVDLYNEKTKGMKGRPVIGLFTTTVSEPGDTPTWIYSNSSTKPEDWSGNAEP